jgi:DNA primase
MAKISPVSIKYMIHANFRVEGALEKPDVIGAIFGQTEGLLGSDLELRELQKEGKIGRIEVEIERKDKITIGKIMIPTALDQSETTLIAAAIETIDKIGPCDAQIEVERIEDVRGSKREYIIERAKKLLSEMSVMTNSKEISKEIKEAARTSMIKEYGEEKLPYGDLSEKEIIVVEGRADVLNLLRNGIKNVIGMNGTKLPESIKKLSEEKDITLFIDGDRGGRLIAQNVIENAKVKYVASAPDGKEVEELTNKEILQALRKRVPAEEFLLKNFQKQDKNDITIEKDIEKIKESLIEIASKKRSVDKVIFLDKKLSEIKEVSLKTAPSFLKKLKEPFKSDTLAIIIYGTATKSLINEAEKKGIKFMLAKNFKTTSNVINLIAF